MSAVLTEDAPYTADEDLVDIGCYQNCVDQNPFCNEDWLITFDEIVYNTPGEDYSNILRLAKLKHVKSSSSSR